VYPDTYRGGQQFSTDGMDLFHLRNGRIERMSAYFDRLGRDDQASDAT
jgi:ketosteroid isomerase-like protein